jgi:DNA-binding transcriptional ArsR family regulator
MSRHNTRRLLALLAAVLVVCSFVAVPAAAGHGDGLDLSSDSESSSGVDDTDDSGGDDTETSSDTETESDSGSDSGDGDSSTTDDSASAGTSSDDEHGEDDETSSDDTDDPRKRLEETVNGTAGVLNETTNTLDETTEATTDAVEQTSGDNVVGETTTSIRTTTDDSVDALALDTSFITGSTIDPTETTYLDLAENQTLRLNTGEIDGPTTGADETTAERSHRTVHEAAVADADDADAGSVVAMSAGTGGGGQPLPGAPTGGVAISFGLLAGMAALRSTPLVAGGLPSLGSIGTGISAPAILSKLRPFIFPLRYSRYDDSDPLEHEAREAVYEIVNESPGSYLSEVSEAADLPLSTTRHHMKVLEREDLVSGTKLRGKRRFYPAYAEGIELAAALNDEATAAIIDAIARLGAASVSDLADDIGRDPSTISHHLQRLEEDGIIRREREGRAVMNKLTGEARTALEPDSTPRPGEAGSAIAGGAD